MQGFLEAILSISNSLPGWSGPLALALLLVAALWLLFLRPRFLYEEARFKTFLEASPDAIVVVDKKGLIRLVNAQTELLFGYDRQALLGQPLEMLIPERFKEAHRRYRSAYSNHPTVRKMGGGAELQCLRKDGSEFSGEISLSPIETQSGTLILSAIRDITSRREFQKQLESSLKEKETLLREIHHRVKNNLQIISSLLILQAEQTKDQETRQALLESQGRILTMALMHERLYQSKTVSNVSLKEYFQDLVKNLSRSYGLRNNRIQFQMEIESANMDPQKLIPLALIANELISNSLKHAFPGGRSGMIRVSLSAWTDEQLQLVVGDNGVGFKNAMDWSGLTSLGLKLVKNLTDQIKGVIELRSDEGTKICIRFPGALGI